jgi:hypothetical protein
MRWTPLAAVLSGAMIVGSGCAGAERTARAATHPAAGQTAAAAATGALAPEQESFWAGLKQHCGKAYSGRVSDATPYYRAGVEGRRLVAHFLDCSADRMHIALHIDDNRSRNWILTRSDRTLRLKHDHRAPDGSEEDVSQYGGDAPVPGLANRQIFPADAHTARILPERADNFWFMHLVDESTFQYGVHWPRAGHSIRLEFDLSRPVAAPPRPWGY